MSNARREEARRLRSEEGLSVKRIAREVHAAQSTVSLWVRDIVLTPDQQEAIRFGSEEGRRAGRERRVERARAARHAAQDEGRLRARAGDPLHHAGCMLYWGEGTKARTTVGFSNSDPNMVALFVRFLRECYSVSDERIRLTCNCFTNNGLALAEIEDWWLRRLELPRSSLGQSIVNNPSRVSKGKHRVLVHGTVQVRVFSTAIVQSIYGAIQEYAGIERPEWLDGR